MKYIAKKSQKQKSFSTTSEHSVMKRSRGTLSRPKLQALGNDGAKGSTFVALFGETPERNKAWREREREKEQENVRTNPLFHAPFLAIY